MTNEDAVEILTGRKQYGSSEPEKETMEYRQALDLAIKALEEKPQGEWIEHSCYKDVIICSNCNSGDSRWNKDFKFCPNCGADMRKGGAE